MNPGELCICGHTFEEHFGHDCSRLYLSGAPCPCKQFVICELAVPMFEAMKALLPYLPDRIDELSHAANSDESRASNFRNFQVAAARVRELFGRIETE